MTLNLFILLAISSSSWSPLGHQISSFYWQSLHFIGSLLLLLLLLLLLIIIIIIIIMDLKPESKPMKAGREISPRPYKGVRMRQWGRWVSEVRMPKNGHKIWLGTFDDPKKAARAHDAALYCLRGNNAVFNFPNEKRPIYPPGSLSNEKIKEIAASFAELNESEPPVTNEVPGNLQDLPCIPPPVTIQVPGNLQDLPYIPPPPATVQVQGDSQYLPCILPPPVNVQVPGGSQNLPYIPPPPATVQVRGDSNYLPYIPPPPVTVQVPGGSQNLPYIPVISEMEGAGAGVSEPPCLSRTMEGASSPEHLFSDDVVLRFMDWLVK